MTPGDIGKQLIAVNWRQGSLVDPSPYRLFVLVSKGTEPTSEPTFWSHAPIAIDDHLVIVSQDCDINKNEQSEPYVEAIRAFWTTDRGLIRNARRNAIRYFSLRESVANDGKPSALIADAGIRVLIDKAALVDLRPGPGLTESTPDSLYRFQQWLAARYNRPAIPDEIVLAVHKPIVDAIGKLPQSSPLWTLLDRLAEVRYALGNDSPPWRVQLLFLRDETTAEGRELDALTAAPLADWFITTLRATGRSLVEDWTVSSLHEISARDLLSTTALPLSVYSLDL